MTDEKIKNLLFAIRIRGAGRIQSDVAKTFQLLGLRYKYNATLLPENPNVSGMLFKVKDHITWGEINQSTFTKLIEKRGYIKGEGRITDKIVKEKYDCNDFSELTEAVMKEQISIKDLFRRGLKKVFRLHPPKGGFKYSSKRPFNDRGELGYRGDRINELINRMV